MQVDEKGNLINPKLVRGGKLTGNPKAKAGTGDGATTWANECTVAETGERYGKLLERKAEAAKAEAAKAAPQARKATKKDA